MMASHILPKALPDETLYSLVSRFGWLNGLAGRKTCELLFGNKDKPPLSDTVADLEHFCITTENAYGKPDEVLNTLTLRPFFRNMATYPAIETPTAEPVGMPATHWISGLGLANLSNSQPHIWRLCPTCVAQDIENFGISYWHRTHQLPGVVVCLLHDQPLLEARIPYWARQKRFLGPESLQASFETIACCQRHNPTNAALDIARFAKNALNSRNCDTTPAIVRAVILDTLRVMGLANRAGEIRPKEFSAHFMAHHAELGDIDHFSTHLDIGALTRLAKALNASPLILPPTPSLLITSGLFGSWRLFRANCQWREIIDTPDLALQPEVLGGSWEKSRNEHRKACLEFMASAPSASRTDFWHEYPRACRWLANHDNDWLESRLPIAKKHFPKQLLLF